MFHGMYLESRNQLQEAPQPNKTSTITRTSTPMYEGEAPTPAFTPKQHVVDIRPESQQNAAVAPSPQATYTRLEKHGGGKVSLFFLRFLLLHYFTSVCLACVYIDIKYQILKIPCPQAWP